MNAKASNEDHKLTSETEDKDEPLTPTKLQSMLVVSQRILTFNTKNIYFCDYPFDIDGCAAANFIFCKNKVDATGFTCLNKFTAVIDLTKDIDFIWKNIRRRSREYINQARREGIRVSLNQYYDEFYQINKAFHHIGGFGLIFGMDIPTVQTMKKYATLFTAEYGGEVLGGNLFLEDENHIRLWQSAFNRHKVAKRKAALMGKANRLIYWEAINYAREKGIKEFDFGGIWVGEEAAQDYHKRNVNSFKLSFGAEMLPRYIYKKSYSPAYRLAQSLNTLLGPRLRKIKWL